MRFIMKTVKKIGIFTLSLIMCLTISVGAFASNIIIDSPSEYSEYSAYRLLDRIDDSGNYAVNTAYHEILQEVTGKTEGQDIIKYIQSIKDNAQEVRSFADNVYKKVKDMVPDMITSENIFKDAEQGYYLIAETKKGCDSQVYSLAMLDTAGEENITITPKKDEPTLEKQVKNNDIDIEDWGLAGDYQIGDTVEFRIITTVPEYADSYDEYTYTVHDTMSAGLYSNVKTEQDVKILVYNEGTPLSSDYYTVSVKEDDPNSFSADIDIVKAIKDGKIKATDLLYIYYTGTLNENAVIYTEGKQDNSAYLEYSTDPYDSEKKASTPTKKTYVWTFKMEVNKVDSKNNPLTGAKFVLSKSKDLNIEELTDTNGSLRDGEESNLIPLVFVSDDEPYYRPAAQDEIAQGTIVYEIEAGDVLIKGLDDCTDYYLYETKAPDGYNRLTKPTYFQIIEQGCGEAGDVTPAVTVFGDINTERADIINNSGVELPSTGGIGTIIFYVVGGAIAVLAGILLINKKRMNNRD